MEMGNASDFSSYQLSGIIHCECMVRVKVKAQESKLLVMYSWVWTTIIVSKNHVYMLNAFNCSRTPTSLKDTSVLPLVYISMPRAI